jgi:hypothetical protein
MSHYGFKRSMRCKKSSCKHDCKDCHLLSLKKHHNSFKDRFVAHVILLTYVELTTKSELSAHFIIKLFEKLQTRQGGSVTSKCV